jgi:8-oxo-dGTP pyrophosphatase MutT (NUDIX family)
VDSEAVSRHRLAMTVIAIPRDAATLILIRESDVGPKVLMGQRGKGASFMPSKFVFPGGALDLSDRALANEFSMNVECRERLTTRSTEDVTPEALALAAIRETWEETGLPLGHENADAAASLSSDDKDWQSFFTSGLMPATDALTFIFRAITPPSRSKRFDARFFMVTADIIKGDPDDLTRASGELSHLSWLTLAEARRLDLPFVTEVVLAEVEARLSLPEIERSVPFFHHDGERSYLDHL